VTALLLTNFCICSSSGYNDELAWAAAWLFRATGEQSYLNQALEFADPGATAWAYNWNEKTVGAQVSIFQYKSHIKLSLPIIGRLVKAIAKLPCMLRNGLDSVSVSGETKSGTAADIQDNSPFHFEVGCVNYGQNI
jgi:Glycosyl hydrolase family 9